MSFPDCAHYPEESHQASNDKYFNEKKLSKAEFVLSNATIGELIFSYLDLDSLYSCRATSTTLRSSVDALVLTRNKLSKLKSESNLLGNIFNLRRLRDVEVNFSTLNLLGTIYHAFATNLKERQIYRVGNARWIHTRLNTLLKIRLRGTIPSGDQIFQEKFLNLGMMRNLFNVVTEFPNVLAHNLVDGKVFYLVVKEADDVFKLLTVDTSDNERVSSSTDLSSFSCFKYQGKKVQVTRGFVLCFTTTELTLIKTGNYPEKIYERTFDWNGHVKHLLTEEYLMSVCATEEGNGVAEIRDLINGSFLVKTINLGLHLRPEIVESAKYIIILAEVRNGGMKAWVWSKQDKTVFRFDLCKGHRMIEQAFVHMDRFLFVEFFKESVNEMKVFLLPSGRSNKVLAIEGPLSKDVSNFQYLEDERLLAYNRLDTNKLTLLSLDPERQVDD